MTLIELERFVAEARSAGAADDARVRMESTWRQTIKSLSVDADLSVGEPNDL